MAADPRTRTPRSRRDRPAKPPLSREGIINVALEILQAEGLGRVTMRRIATVLDTGPASLYVYVRDTEDLHAQILDVLVSRMESSPTEGSWRDRLYALLAAYGRILLAHPEIARMTLTTQPIGPHYFALVEAVLDLLSEGGISDETAAWGVDLLLAAVTATAVEHGASEAAGTEGDRVTAMAAAIAMAPGTRFPRIARLGHEMLAGTGTERFHWGLDVLVNGLLQSPRSPTAASTDEDRESVGDVDVSPAQIAPLGDVE